MNQAIFKNSLILISVVYLSTAHAAIPLSHCTINVPGHPNARAWLTAANNIDSFEFNEISHVHDDFWPCAFVNPLEASERGLLIESNSLTIIQLNSGVSRFRRERDKCILVRSVGLPTQDEVRIRTNMCNAFLAAAGVPSN